MAAHYMDPLQCFTSISDNVPSWITRVTELAAHTSRKRAEFSEEFKRLTHIQSSQRERRRKNSSVHSIRPDSELRAGKSTAAAVSKQAVGTASNVSGEATPVVRVRRQLVIYYDSHTQTELEQVVRDIGNARNCLRKGKMSQVMCKPSLELNMFSSRSRDSLLSPDGFRRARIPPVVAGSPQKETAFDFADKQLEIAQSLCETAAHQFLRAGDCKKELQNVLAKFQIVLQTVTNEAVRLREEKEQNPESQQAKETIPAVDRRSPSMRASFKPIGIAEDDKPPEPGSATIEVDDSASGSSISIDITAFRSNRFRV